MVEIVSGNYPKVLKMNEKPRGGAEFWFQEIGFLLAGVDASWACLAGREWSADGADEGRNQAQSHADLGGALGNSGLRNSLPLLRTRRL